MAGGPVRIPATVATAAKNSSAARETRAQLYPLLKKISSIHTSSANTTNNTIDRDIGRRADRAVLDRLQTLGREHPPHIGASLCP